MIGKCAVCHQSSLVCLKCTNPACGFVFCNSCSVVFCPRCATPGDYGGLFGPRQSSEASKGDASTQARPSDAVARRDEDLPCPHCGDAMPSDAAKKKYTRHQCGGEIYWMEQKPYKSQDDANKAAGWATDDDSDWDDDDEDVAAAHKPKASNSPLVQLGTCMYACALLVAADGNVTEREADLLCDGLSWSGLDRSQLKQKFVEACRRVRKEGATKWAQIVTKTLTEDDHGAGSGMPKDSLKKLLKRLINAEPADRQQKQELFKAIQAGFASSASASKPVRGIRNPFTGESQ